jgi:hypothetical protein
MIRAGLGVIAALACAGVALAQSRTAVVAIAPSIPPNTTVAGLPVCSATTSGWVYRVTDALVPALNGVVVGGGAVAVVVRCNATSWLVGQ